MAVVHLFVGRGLSTGRPFLKIFAVSLLLALVAAACTDGGSNQAGDEPVFDDLVFEAEPSNNTDEVPGGLSFAEDSGVLRVSVPNLVYTVPYELEETNAVQVLLTDLLTDGLTRRNAVDGSIEPAIADSWTTSADGLTWTFDLGTATFADGSVIAASDVVASLNRVADRGVSSVSSPNLWSVDGWIAAGAGEDAPEVAGIEAIGEDQVQFTLTTPFASLAEILAGVVFGVVPADVESLFVEGGELPISSAVDYVPERMWVDGLTVAARSEASETVAQIEVLLDPELTMLRAGETDMAVGFEDSTDDLDSLTSPSSAISYFAMNSSQAPFDDALIRQAILHAVDVSELRDEFFSATNVMMSLIPEPIGVESACGAACDFDPEQARTLVQASPSRDVVVTIDFVDPFAEDDAEQGEQPAGLDEELAVALAAMLTDVGLNVELAGHSPEQISDLVADGSLGMFRFGSVSSTLAAEASIGLPFHTNGLDNVTSTSIDRVDALIGQARETTDDEDRAELYTDAERILFAEAVVLPLVEFNHTVLLGDTLTAAGLEPDGSLNLAELEFTPAE